MLVRGGARHGAGARRGALRAAVAIAIAMAGVASQGSLAAAQAAADTAGARAEALFSAGNYAGAAAAFDALARAHPERARYWVRLGASLQQGGRGAEAIAAYRRAVALTPAPFAAYGMSAIFAKQGQRDSAFHWLGQSVTMGFGNDKVLDADPDFASLRSDARYAAAVERIRTAMRPCQTRKESRMFDFWVGEWDVKTAQGQPAGRSSVQLLLEGCALLENWTDSQNGQGKSLNSYNTDKQMWQQFWTDQYGRVTEYRESDWRGDTLRYTARQTMPRGPAVLHMSFAPLGPDLVRQWGEISYDDGKTWAQSFDLYYHRTKP
jgi:tetratricopeptide (TPR) repeat protein